MNKPTKHECAAYITLRDGPVASTDEVVPGAVLADYDANGSCVGIEMLVLTDATVRLVDERHDMRAFAIQQSRWSQSTFGADAERGPIGPAKHLAKEVLCELLGMDREAATALLATLKGGDGLRDVEEWCDAVFLVLDGSRRAGFSYDQLLAACWAKLKKNKARTWGAASSDEPVEHDRSGEASA